MFSNTIGSEFTRMREQNNSSLYRNNGNGQNVDETLRFAHTSAGKFGTAELKRHLMSYDIVVKPTQANGLLKSERLTVNLTVTSSDGVPIAIGSGDFSHLAVVHGLTNILRLLHSTAPDLAGWINVTNFLNGEI